jgi:hypothetical protein
VYAWIWHCEAADEFSKAFDPPCLGVLLLLLLLLLWWWWLVLPSVA